MTKSVSRSYIEQLNILKSRGMIIDENINISLTKMETIGYYKIKEFARPFENNGKYDDMKLKAIIDRFYYDKNMRMHFLHAIEKIEISLKIKIAYLFGEKYGAFGYLNFFNWCDKDKLSTNYIKREEDWMKKKIKKASKKVSKYNPDYNDAANLSPEGFPTIWLGINILMFGDLESILKNMSRDNAITIAREYNLNYKTFQSMIGLIHLVRNICCHNSNLSDRIFNTIPNIDKACNNLDKKLYTYTTINKNGKIIKLRSNRLALVTIVVKYFVDIINPKYKWDDIIKDIIKLSKPVKKNGTELYEHLGFANSNSLNYIFPNKKTLIKRTTNRVHH
jgi:abortive infection bacteriophage resistance protein